MDLGLKDKVILITGASGGIGEAAAKMFDHENARLVLHYNRNRSRIERLSRELSRSPLIVQADLSVESEVVRMFKEIDEKIGRIDVLVANAGIWPAEHVEIKDMSFERWKHTMAVDLDSVFLCSREFLKQLERYPGEQGNIIIVGSTAAIFGEAGHADYSAAKAAITHGLTLSLKNEIVNVARLGRVNAVCPGWTITPMTKEYLNDKKSVLRTLKTIPLRKIAQAEDVASIIVMLASDKVSGHVTGQIITVAGGMEGRTLFEKEDLDITRAFKL